MGDALAVCLMELKGFQTDDFAKFHPGGTLGKNYTYGYRICISIMKNQRSGITDIKGSDLEMTRKRLGITAVVDNENNLLGIITDGDLRRMLEKNVAIDTIKVNDIMTQNPQTIEPDKLAVEALDILRKKEISNWWLLKKENILVLYICMILIREGLI